MEPKHIFKIEEDFENIRLDKWFKKKVKSLPQSLIERTLRKGKILVNGKKAKSSYKIQINDEIKIYADIDNDDKIIKKKFSYLPSKKDYDLIKNNILFENEHYFVLNKPYNLAVQSGTKTAKNIFDILKNYSETEYLTPHLVHRLDAETTGILIISKTHKSAKFFSEAFKNQTINKSYLAVVDGILENKSGTLKNELSYLENNKEKVHLSITNYKVITETKDYSLLLLNPETGRKHQLRRQLSFIKHPILGEKKYTNKGLNKTKELHLMLHAYKVEFLINSKKIIHHAEPSLYFQSFCKEQKLIYELNNL
ncbi:MAG: RluA family pseudouridine synthase [Proteobacteria bacterium]|nr:RluA family pseudouridine synthase [Candidatus Fonsibacter sp. PEL4]